MFCARSATSSPSDSYGTSSLLGVIVVSYLAVSDVLSLYDATVRKCRFDLTWRRDCPEKF